MEVHRLAASAVVLVAVVFAGCGEATSTGSAARDRTPTPLLPSTTPSDESPTGSTLLDLPLALGYPDENGFDHTPVEVTEAPGIDDLRFCDRLGWSSSRPVRPVDLAGASYRGEAEDSRGRTVVRYPEAAIAQEALGHLREVVGACPESSDGDYGAAHTITDREAGFLVTTRYFGPGGFDTGLTLYDAARVGDLVFLNWAYGEAGGSAESIHAATGEITAQTDELVLAMRRFTGRG